MPNPPVAPALRSILHLADNCLILSQQLAQWCGHGPALEEDIASTNVALDLLGHAQLWLRLVADRGEAFRDGNHLAFFRGSSEYTNLLLVEQPNGDYAQTLVRQCFVDLWYRQVLQRLTTNQDAEVRAIAAKGVKEARYHAERSGDWVIRLGDGTEESHNRMQSALDRMWPYTGEMFEATEAEAAAQGAHDLAGPEIYPLWSEQLDAILHKATLQRPADCWMHTGGRSGQHSEHLSYILTEMQALPRQYPEAQW